MRGTDCADEPGLRIVVTPSLPRDETRCANCGAVVSGAFCAACGQSRDALAQPFFTLALEWLGDLFSLDGRLARTLVVLFTRPGRLARAYADGKRASYTPPIRLFLLSTVVLLAVMAAFDMRLITVTARGAFVPAGGDVASLLQDRTGGLHLGLSADETDGTSYATVTISLLGVGRGVQAEPVPDRVVAGIAKETAARGLPAFIVAAIADPDAVEAAVNTAATQALFAMVAAFALLNALIHPRRRLIEHAVHALYFHAAVALTLAVWIPVAHVLPIARGVVAVSAFAALAVGAILFDRGFYGTRILGRLWRMPLLVFGYAVALSLIMVAFTTLSIPR